MFRSDMLYIEDILNSINAIEEFVSVVDFKVFSNDRKTSSATIRELEVIGEAVGKISDELKTEYPDINWRDLKDLRNLLIHEYFGIDFEIIWNIIPARATVKYWSIYIRMAEIIPSAMLNAVMIFG